MPKFIVQTVNRGRAGCFESCKSGSRGECPETYRSNTARRWVLSLLNSVSFADGYKYYSNFENTGRLRVKSDRICEEYDLSVIYEPKCGRRPSHEVYQSEQWGGDTYRSQLRAAVDKAISESLSNKEFFAILKKMGYTVESGKDITVKATDRKYGLKLFRNFGENYTRQAINDRILSHGMPQRMPPPPKPPPAKRVQYKGNIQNVWKFTGFRAFVYPLLLSSGRQTAMAVATGTATADRKASPLFIP